MQLHFHLPAVHIHSAAAAVGLSGVAVLVSNHGRLSSAFLAERAAITVCMVILILQCLHMHCD